MVPFSEAKTVWADLPGNWMILFKWYGREFHDLFPPGEQGAGTTLYLGIAETPLADWTPKGHGTSPLSARRELEPLRTEYEMDAAPDEE